MQANVRVQAHGLLRVTYKEGLGAAFDVLHIGDPVALPSRETRLFPFTIEACRRTTKERLIDAFERVDADNRVKMIVDPTGDDRHYAAAGAGVELRGSGTECVLGYERRIFDHHLQSAAWVGGPYTTVLGAKRAAAIAGRNFDGIGLPCEGEGDVPAVTFTLDQHACNLRWCSLYVHAHRRAPTNTCKARRSRARPRGACC